MYVRCGECRHVTWVEPVHAGSSVEWVCSGCEKRAAIPVAAKLGTGSHERFRKALDFANRHCLDLPSAWSVLAEIMTLEQAHACRADMGLELPGVSRTRALRRRGGDGIDESRPGATEAERSSGSRASTAGRARTLARRHKIPVGLASRVLNRALNFPSAWLLRPTLGNRLRGAPGPASDATAPAEGATRAWLARPVWILGAAVLASVAAWSLWPGSDSDAAAPELRSPPAGTETRRDAAGHPVEISGPDPESVLVAYCNQNDAARRCRPLKLVFGSPPRAGARWGVFERPSEPGVVEAIQIRREGGARRWVAGDGEARIRPVDAYDLADGSVEIPVPGR